MFLAQGLLNQGMDVLVVFDNQYTRHSGLLLWDGQQRLVLAWSRTFSWWVCLALGFRSMSCRHFFCSNF